jgi:dTDP-4-dehydrorhamnose reductase
VRVVVTGAGGLLGGRLAAILQRRGADVLALHRRAAPPPGPRAQLLELTDTDAVARLLDAERPDALVHAAVLGRADRCEERPDEAERVNARLPGELARLCRERGIRLVGVSTDLVFDGERAFSREGDATVPLGVYGRTKRRGEEALLASCPGAAIARVALVVGRGHGSRATASEAIAWALGAGRPARLYADELRSPVDPESVADGLSRLLAGGHSGCFHLAGAERMSRLDLGRRVARALVLPESLLEAARQADHPGPDPRPADVSLDVSRARRELGWEPRPIDEALREGRPGPDAAAATSGATAGGR